MPNKHYVKGYSRERMCRKQLESEGYYSIRSGGSKGIVDVVGVDINMTRLIQVKTTKTNMHTFTTDENIKKLIDLPVHNNCRKELWIYSEVTKKWLKKEM